MIYRVSLTAGTPEFETLPVAKITRYPLEKADYKPFAQCCLCAAPGGLALRMWAFEVNTSPESELRAVLYPFGDRPFRAVHIAIHPSCASPTASDLCIWLEEKGEKTFLEGQGHPHNGEDLQGVYWGSDIFLPLEQLGEGLLIKEGDHFPGNFYKIRKGKQFEHYGSYAPAKFPNEPFRVHSMADFQMVSY